ncbi:MAG TPA: ABC transporter ATP-binding protein [Clostridiaceae bacterium]|nr:ABC transporter ATP-binding protein [Clostridiaceae bacterium]
MRKTADTEPILSVRGLEITFKTDQGDRVFLRDASFDIRPGEVLGIVGESGSGKSITALSVMGLLPVSGLVSKGEAWFEGQDLFALSPRQLDKIRGKRLSMIFQDALTSLNPVFTIGNQIVESIRAHQDVSKTKARQMATDLLDRVGMADPETVLGQYAHMLSGGMRQRAMIAMALASEPALIIADEATSSLDVTIQAQIMHLLRELSLERDMSVLLITHDIGLIAQMADQVAVMYAGEIVENTDVFTLFEAPGHPYTRALLETVPSIEDDKDRELRAIPGVVPEDYYTITGCRFASRCSYVKPERCSLPQIMLPLDECRQVRCLRAQNNELEFVHSTQCEASKIALARRKEEALQKLTDRAVI